ncbi:MAG: ferredoxin [Promethearchaeota archaeon]
MKVRQKARYVELDKCTGCGMCWSNCPTSFIPANKIIKKGSGGGMINGTLTSKLIELNPASVLLNQYTYAFQIPSVASDRIK